MTTHQQQLRNHINNQQEFINTSKLLRDGEKEEIRHDKAVIKLKERTIATCEASVALYNESIALAQKEIAETHKRLEKEK